MNVLIMAAGSLGGYIGSEISKSKSHNVTLIARNQHLKKIQENGLVVKSATSGNYICNAEAYEKPIANYKADLILYCVKSYQNLQAIPVIKNSAHSDTTILTLQNGIGSGEILASHFDANNIILGSAYIDASTLDYGIIKEHGGDCKIFFGNYQGNNNYHIEKIKEALKSTNIKYHLSKEILTTIWEKLIFISGLSGRTCITNSTFEEVLSYEQTRHMTKSLITETYNVGIRSGIKLDKSITENTMKYFIDFKSELTSSMHQDLINGNQLEVESINGAISKIGKLYDVSTPINDIINDCLSLINNRRK